ncbi:MAG TPA: NAD(P)H-dependent oxidoreductase subunit E [Chthonomonadales bacterium]|nr:NAD(P)H-dependent oxidoreductase subunit E [Chthonomonadales bacterium]
MALLSQAALEEIERIARRYHEPRAAMLPALWVAQREYGGWIPRDALEAVASALNQPSVEVEGVATFYTMFNLRPRGRHHIEVCTCLTCGTQGAYDVLHRLSEHLGVAEGETTSDGEFTLCEAECLNWCSQPVVIQIGDRYHTGLDPESAVSLVESLRGVDRQRPQDLAAAIVGVHQPAHLSPGDGAPGGRS